MDEATKLEIIEKYRNLLIEIEKMIFVVCSVEHQNMRQSMQYLLYWDFLATKFPNLSKNYEKIFRIIIDQNVVDMHRLKEMVDILCKQELGELTIEDAHKRYGVIGFQKDIYSQLSKKQKQDAKEAGYAPNNPHIIEID